MALSKHRQSKSYFVLLCFVLSYLPIGLLAGYAPDKAPKLPENVSDINQTMIKFYKHSQNMHSHITVLPEENRHNN